MKVSTSISVAALAPAAMAAVLDKRDPQAPAVVATTPRATASPTSPRAVVPASSLPHAFSPAIAGIYPTVAIDLLGCSFAYASVAPAVPVWANSTSTAVITSGILTKVPTVTGAVVTSLFTDTVYMPVASITTTSTLTISTTTTKFGGPCTPGTSKAPLITPVVNKPTSPVSSPKASTSPAAAGAGAAAPAPAAAGAAAPPKLALRQVAATSPAAVPTVTQDSPYFVATGKCTKLAKILVPSSTKTVASPVLTITPTSTSFKYVTVPGNKPFTQSIFVTVCGASTPASSPLVGKPTSPLGSVKPTSPLATIKSTATPSSGTAGAAAGAAAPAPAPPKAA